MEKGDAATATGPVGQSTQPFTNPEPKRIPHPARKRRKPRTWLGRWLQNLRISRKLAVVITVHLLHAAVLLVVTTYGLKAVDAGRAWVDGEGFWAKAQKESVIQLLAYADSGGEEHLQSALEQINVTLGDRQARLELEKPDPDLAVARAGFIQARNHPDDVDNMIWLFQTFRRESHISHAIDIWTRAEDDGIETLRGLATTLHAQRTAPVPDAAAINESVQQILEVNAFLEDLEHQFSSTLGDGTRFINRVVVMGTIGLTLAFVGTALLISSLVARQITQSLGQVKAGAERMAGGEIGIQLDIEGRDDVARVAQSFNAMSKQLASTVGEREDHASVLAATLEATTDGLLVVDARGKIVQYNKNFLTLWRIPNDVVESRSDERALAFVLDQLLDPEAFLAKVKALYNDPEAESFDVLHFKDGRVFERYSKPQRVHGQTAGRVWSFRDVTARRRAEAEQQRTVLREAEVEELKRTNAFKSRFLNTAAHELNTPLTPIILQLHLLEAQASEMNDEQRHSVVILARNMYRMRRLVQDLLDAARLDAKRLKVNKTLTDLNTVITETVDSFRPSATESRVNLDLELPAPAMVMADRLRVAQVLFNLISNALKATPPGGRIVVQVVHEATEVAISVRDTGRGLTAAEIQQLFQPFTQIHDPELVHTEGTGLGLFVARGIVEALGGRIWCESQGPGRGSTFAFTMPKG